MAEPDPNRDKLIKIVEPAEGRGGMSVRSIQPTEFDAIRPSEQLQQQVRALLHYGDGPAGDGPGSGVPDFILPEVYNARAALDRHYQEKGHPPINLATHVESAFFYTIGYSGQFARAHVLFVESLFSDRSCITGIKLADIGIAPREAKSRLDGSNADVQRSKLDLQTKINVDLGAGIKAQPKVSVLLHPEHELSIAAALIQANNCYIGLISKAQADSPVISPGVEGEERRSCVVGDGLGGFSRYVWAGLSRLRYGTTKQFSYDIRHAANAGAVGKTPASELVRFAQHHIVLRGQDGTRMKDTTLDVSVEGRGDLLVKNTSGTPVMIALLDPLHDEVVKKSK